MVAIPAAAAAAYQAIAKIGVEAAPRQVQVPPLAVRRASAISCPAR